MQEACRADRVDAGQDECLWELRLDADHKDDFADHRDRLVLPDPWGVENRDGLDHRRRHPAVDAWVDRGALAGRDADRLDDRRKASDPDCQWAKDRDYPLEAGHDYQ